MYLLAWWQIWHLKTGFFSAFKLFFRLFFRRSLEQIKRELKKPLHHGGLLGCFCRIRFWVQPAHLGFNPGFDFAHQLVRLAACAGDGFAN